MPLTTSNIDDTQGTVHRLCLLNACIVLLSLDQPQAAVHGAPEIRRLGRRSSSWPSKQACAVFASSSPNPNRQFCDTTSVLTLENAISDIWLSRCSVSCLKEAAHKTAPLGLRKRDYRCAQRGGTVSDRGQIQISVTVKRSPTASDAVRVL